MWTYRFTCLPINEVLFFAHVRDFVLSDKISDIALIPIAVTGVSLASETIVVATVTLNSAGKEDYLIVCAY